MADEMTRKERGTGPAGAEVMAVYRDGVGA